MGCADKRHILGVTVFEIEFGRISRDLKNFPLFSHTRSLEYAISGDAIISIAILILRQKWGAPQVNAQTRRGTILSEPFVGVLSTSTPERVLT